MVDWGSVVAIGGGILAGAVATGVLLQKVQTLTDRADAQDTKIADLSGDVDSVRVAHQQVISGVDRLNDSIAANQKLTTTMISGLGDLLNAKLEGLRTEMRSFQPPRARPRSGG